MSSSGIGLFSWLQGTQEYLVGRGWAGAKTEHNQEGRTYLQEPLGFTHELSIHFLTQGMCIFYQGVFNTTYMM